MTRRILFILKPAVYLYFAFRAVRHWLRTIQLYGHVSQAMASNSSKVSAYLVLHVMGPSCNFWYKTGVKYRGVVTGFCNPYMELNGKMLGMLEDAGVRLVRGLWKVDPQWFAESSSAMEIIALRESLPVKDDMGLRASLLVKDEALSKLVGEVARVASRMPRRI